MYYNSSLESKVLCSATSGLTDFFKEQKIEIDEILEINKLDKNIIGKSTTRIKLEQYCNLFEDAVHITQQDNLGLKFGQQFKPQDLGLLGYLALSSTTLRDAFSNIIKAFPIHQQQTLLCLSRKDDNCYISYEIFDKTIKKKRQDAEISLGMFTNIIRHVHGSEWAPDKVCFQHARPIDWEEHVKLFNCPVYFEQSHNALVFNNSILDSAMPMQDVNLLELIKENLDRLETKENLENYGYQNEFIDDVKTCIQQNLENTLLSLEVVSEKLRIPYWTLQRRLSKVNITFSNLLDTVRQEQALIYLKEKDVTISEIAFLLGYSEVSSFSRAFRRWFGVSPKQWVKAA